MLQARRKLERKQSLADWQALSTDGRMAHADRSPTPERSVLDKMAADQLWAVVDSCCTDERERLIARLSLVADLKPRAILDHHPELFADVTEIYMIRRNLKNRLERNERLRFWWGEDIV